MTSAASGAVAANRLGLSSQVPAKSSYVTNGPSRAKKVDGRTIALRRSRAPLLDHASDQVNSVLQALAHIGKGNFDADLIYRCADRRDDREMKTLFKSRTLMPGWMGDIVLKISLIKRSENG